MKGTCEICRNDNVELYEAFYNNEESKMLCKDCLGWAEVQAEYEYERQKEEETYYSQCESDHEREGGE